MKKIIVSLTILILLVGTCCIYMFYEHNVKTSSHNAREETKKIIFDYVEKDISLTEYEEIKKILDNLTWSDKTIDAKAINFLTIDGIDYYLQTQCKAILMDGKQGIISKDTFDLLFNLISK